MSPRLTDQAVSELPLYRGPGRAPGGDHVHSTAPIGPTCSTRKGRGEVVAGWRRSPRPLPQQRWSRCRAGSCRATSRPAVFAGAPAHDWVVLDAPGWTSPYVSDPGDGESEVEWHAGRGDPQRQPPRRRPPGLLRRGPAAHRPPAAWTPVRPSSSSGRRRSMWPYSPATTRPSVRSRARSIPRCAGEGMGEAAYVALLGQLAWTDQAELRGSRCPRSSSRAGEADDDHRRDAPRHPPGARCRGAELGRERPLPARGRRGAPGASARGSPSSPGPGRRGTARAVEDAQKALAGSRDWAFLDAMNAEGDYPEVVWEMSADVNAGRVPPRVPPGARLRVRPRCAQTGVIQSTIMGRMTTAICRPAHLRRRRGRGARARPRCRATGPVRRAPCWSTASSGSPGAYAVR